MDTYERFAPSKGAVSVTRAFDSLSVDDRIHIVDLYTDITVQNNTIVSCSAAAINTNTLSQGHLYNVASFRRLAILDNQITHSLSDDNLSSGPANPQGAITLDRIAEGTVVSGNMIVGGQGHGIVFRRLDPWNTEVPARSYEVVISDNCIAPRNDSWYGLARREARPLIATLIIENNHYNGSWDGWGGDPEGRNLDTYAPHNNARYQGDCSERLP